MRKQIMPFETMLPLNAVFKVGSKKVQQIENET